jgi:competence protein ComEA
MKILAMTLLSAGLLFGAVDINTANAEELATLKGVGEKKAAKIIKYRKEKCFENIEELAKVKGIKKKVVEQNKDNLAVSVCKVK